MRDLIRPPSVVIRTVGDDSVAWDRSRDARFVLPALHGDVLAGIPTTWISEADLLESIDREAHPIAGCLEELIDAGLVIARDLDG